MNISKLSNQEIICLQKQMLEELEKRLSNKEVKNDDLESVKQDSNTIEYIMQLEAVKQDGWAIRFIKNPSEQMQLEAVKQNGFAIYFIKNPSKKVKQMANKK